MPRFTIKDMLLAMTLIAVGAGMLTFLDRNRERTFGQSAIGAIGILLMWYGSGACVGAGLFTPFKRPWLGVLIAVAIQSAFIMLPFRLR
jgi:uncharacterized membrane protein YczE